MSVKTWWQHKSGPAKLVTALTTLLILQIGLCFASPGEPAWFDRVFHIHPMPDQLRLGLVVVEAYLSIGTFIFLLIALLVWGTSSFTETDSKLTLIARDTTTLNGTDHEDSGDSQ
jgi:integral membrane sensor domain MASE1